MAQKREERHIPYVQLKFQTLINLQVTLTPK